MRKFFSLATIRDLLIIFFVCAVLVFPLNHHGFIVTDDGNWMVIRLSAFYQSLREGQFPVRFLGRLNYGYGYPVANFLYPGFLYIGSMLHVIGFSFVNSVKLLFVGSVLGGAFFIYAWLRKSFQSLASIFGTLGYVLAPYLAFDIYTRGSIGEVLAMCWAAMGLYSIDTDRKWLFTVAVSLLIVSHNTLALMVLVFFIAYLLLTGRMKTFLPSVCMGIGMVAFFWIPALHERKYVIFDSVQVADVRQYFLGIETVWLIGINAIIAFCILLYRKHFKKKEKFFVGIFLLSIFLALPVSFFLWRIHIVESLFQFPFRFLSLGLLVTPWMIASLVQHKRTPVGLIMVGMVIIWIIQGWYITTHIRYDDQPDGYYSTNEATTTVQDEYMPKWVSEKPITHSYSRVQLSSGDASLDIKQQTSQHIIVAVDARANSMVQFNTIYYPGWGITVDDQLVTPEYHNPEGLIRIPVPAGKHIIEASFRETVSRFLADIFSVAVGIVFLVQILLSHTVVAKKTQRRNRLHV